LGFDSEESRTRSGNQQLHHFAYQVLGQQFERVLPDVMLVWFVALLLLASEGRSRMLGWVLIPIVVVAEVVAIVGPLLGFAAPFVKVSLLLPVVWLIFESAKRAPTGPPSTLVLRTPVALDSPAYALLSCRSVRAA
jgi:hypothetical protein